jgi:hypothetical protein
MGYNTKVLLAKNLDREQVADIIPDVFEITNESINFEAASSYNLAPNLAIGEINDWVIIWDVYGKLVLDQSVVKEFAVFEAVSFDLSSTSDRYQMLYARQKRVVREVVYQSGKNILSEGQKLESEIGELNEDSIWQLIEQITNITLSKLEEIKYNLVVLD